MDRTRVVCMRYDSEDETTHLLAENCFPGCPSLTDIAPGPYLYSDYREVIDPLMRGEIYSSATVTKTGANHELSASTGSQIDLMVPIFIDRVFWGFICFDRMGSDQPFSEAEIDSLRGIGSSLASMIKRDRIETHSRRELERRDVLNTALVRCNSILLEGRNFGKSMEEALETIRVASGVQMVKLIQVLDECPETGEWELLSEAVAEGYPLQKTSSIVCGSNQYILEQLRQLAGGAEWLEGTPVSNDCALFDSAARELGIKNSLCIPIRIEDRFWGVLALDNCLEAKSHSLSEKAVLCAAARSLGLAIHRRQAQEKLLDSEQRRADENADHVALLENILQASRELIESGDIKTGMKSWLQRIGESCGAHAAGIITSPREDAAESIDIRVSWVSRSYRDRLRYQADHLTIPDTTDFNQWKERLTRGEHIWANYDELEDPRSKAYWDKTGCACNVIVASKTGDQADGFLFFDFGEQRTENPIILSAIKTAADGLGSAIRHHAATAELIEAERERIAQLSQARMESENAVLEERARLAGQIHDTLAQGFTGTMLHLEALQARKRLGQSITPEDLKRVRDIAAFGLSEARRTAFVIRPLQLGDRDLRSALSELADRSTIPHLINCQFEAIGEDLDTTSAIADTFLNIAHEAVGNAMRHSLADQISISLHQSKAQAVMEVKDNGQGFDTTFIEQSRSGLGLCSMRKRADDIGASFRLSSKIGAGTSIMITYKSHPV